MTPQQLEVLERWINSIIDARLADVAARLEGTDSAMTYSRDLDRIARQARDDVMKAMKR